MLLYKLNYEIFEVRDWMASRPHFFLKDKPYPPVEVWGYKGQEYVSLTREGGSGLTHWPVDWLIPVYEDEHLKVEDFV